MKRSTLALLIIVSIASAACGSRELKQTVTPTYSSISAVTLQSRCVRCHSSLATYDGVMAIVKPGDAAHSDLYRQVSSGGMPQQETKLSDAEVGAIYDWIQAGAAQN